ncbi:hypothetical protein V6N13_147807 [Hibiscus sabdariffa]
MEEARRWRETELIVGGTMALPPLWKGCCLPFSFNRNADCPWYNGTYSTIHWWMLSTVSEARCVLFLPNGQRHVTCEAVHVYAFVSYT